MDQHRGRFKGRELNEQQELKTAGFARSPARGPGTVYGPPSLGSGAVLFNGKAAQ